MSHIDLFSGIGGFALATQWAGFQTTVFCEKDKFCQKILRKHWPNVPIVEDIFEFDGTKHTGATLLTGGFPCQPFSVAGKRRGKEDDRWLWPETFRVIREAKPKWVILENVRGLIALSAGMEFENLLLELEDEGYETRAFIIPACGVDAPHRRERVWIVAYTNSDRLETNGCRPTQLFGRGKRGLGYSFGSSGQFEQESNKTLADPDGSGREKQRRSFTIFPEQFASERFSWWEAEPGICRVSDGIPNRVDRLKSLGNAIVPQVAYQILKSIGDINESNSLDGANAP
jgi:DNA (cytosine-5)-methyltransferase 1